MKVLVTGGSGQLGYDISRALTARNIEHILCTREQFDLRDSEQTESYIRAYSPDVVVHCAAYTAVDKAEEERELCYQVNAFATRTIAHVCSDIGAKLVYFSTDYVFEGEGDEFYETSSPVSPLNYYGLTKLEGENAVRELCDRHFIVRISWVFGSNGRNFIKTMAGLGRSHDEVRVVCDQIGSPTYTVDLAELICDMIVTEHYGIYHATNEGICSWAQLAEAIYQVMGISCKVNYVTTAEYGLTVAKRPSNSRLSKASLDAAGFRRLPDWKDALKRYLAEIGMI